MRTRYAFAAAAVATVVSVILARAILNFESDGPPEQALAPATAEVKESTVMANLEVALAPVEGILSKALARDDKGREKPFLSGNTEQIAWNVVGNLFSGKRKTRPSCEVSAAQQNAIEFTECWKRARGNDIEKAWHRTKCTAEFGLESIGSARDLAVACVPKALDVALPNRPTKLPYRVYLEDLDLEMQDDDLGAVAKIRLDLQPPQDLHKYFDTNVKEFECAVRISASAKLALELLADETRIKIKARAGQVQVAPGETCGGAKPAGLASQLDQILLAGASDLFQNLLQEQLEKVLNDPGNLDSINDQLSILPQFLAQDLALPMPEDVPLPASLSISPNALAVSNLSGSGSKAMRLSVGIIAKPVVKLARAPALEPLETFRPDPDKALPIKVRQPDNRFELRPQLSLPLDETTRVATQIANQVVADVLPSLRYSSLSLTLYQADERLVIGVAIRGVGWLRLSGSVYLTAAPHVSEDGKTLLLRDVQFDADSEGFLKRRALWVLESGIEAVLEDRLAFNLDGPMAQAVDALRNLNLPIKVEDKSLGRLTVALNEIALDKLWIDKNTLNVSIVASGRSAVALNSLPQ